MKTYELTFLIPEKFSEEEAKKINEKIKKEFSDSEILKEDFLGRKKLVYPILKNNFAYYQTILFKTNPLNIIKIENKLKLNEDLIRHLIVAIRKEKLEKEKPTKKREAKKPETKEEPVATKTEPKEKKPEKEVKEVEKVKAVKKVIKKKVIKPKKAKPEITEEIEKETEKMKALDEKLDEILKE